MEKPTPTHYIAYPDKSFATAADWEAYPIEGKLGGACIREKDFSRWAHRKESFWNPAMLGERITLPPKHHIVWKGHPHLNIGVTYLEPHELEGWLSSAPQDLNGAACVIAPTGDEAERIAAQDDFWNPVDLEAESARFRQTNIPKAAHYPDAW